MTGKLSADGFCVQRSRLLISYQSKQETFRNILHFCCDRVQNTCRNLVKNGLSLERNLKKHNQSETMCIGNFNLPFILLIFTITPAEAMKRKVSV